MSLHKEYSINNKGTQNAPAKLCRQTFDISHTLADNKIFDHSDVGDGTAPTISSFST